MPLYIVKIRDKYLEYSTITDTPVTSGMSREAMAEYLVQRSGPDRREFIEARLSKCDRRGTTDPVHSSAEDTLRGNRLGLTIDGIYDLYCTQAES